MVWGWDRFAKGRVVGSRRSVGGSILFACALLIAGSPTGARSQASLGDLGIPAGRVPDWHPLDHLPLDTLARYESELFSFIEAKHADVLEDITTKKQLTDELADKLDKAMKQFNDNFVADPSDEGDE